MDISTFLKVHSTISNSFIESFLSMYDPDTIQTDFVVKLSLVSKWLNVKKKELVRTLVASYAENIDYKVEKVLRPPTRKYGNNNKEWLLTPDCFKRLCMRSRSKRAEEVRTYFIQLESLLIRYKSVLLKGMDAEIKQMEKATKPKDPADSAGYIYVIKASPEKDSVYKIGRTQDLNKRLATYSTGRVDGVDIVFKYRTDSYKRTEACIKATLKEFQLRKYKEVYEANLDMIKAVVQKCDDLVTYTRVFSNAKADRQMTGGYYMILNKEDN